MRALVLLCAVACGGGDDDPPIVGPVTPQFITAASVGNTKATRRPDVPPDPVAGPQIVARFLNRTKAGGTGLIAVQSATPIARIVLAIEGTPKDYLEIVSASPFTRYTDASLAQPAESPAAAASEIVVSVEFAANPSTRVFSLRVAAASTAQGTIGEYAVLPVDLTPQSDNPRIGLSRTALTFDGTISSSPPASQPVAITNGGTGTLDRLSIGTIGYSATATTPWLSVVLSGQRAPATLTLRPTTTILPRGTHTATIPVVSLAADASPRLITVTYRVATPPVIGFSPESVVLVPNTAITVVARQSIQITNGGDASLTGLSLGSIAYDGTPPRSWLTVSALSRSTAPATLSVTASALGVSDGTYTASLPVRSSLPNVDAKALRVRFVVKR
jgi:hypothetical protein